MHGGNRRNLNNVMVFLGLLCFLLAAVLAYSFKGKFGQDTAGVTSLGSPMPVMEDTIDVTQKNPSAQQQLSSVAPVEGPAAEQDWVIYVTGSVKKPGVYKIPHGARVYQVLEIAGGFAANADQEAVNLAAMLEDGAHIRFPARGEDNTSMPGAVQPKNSNSQVQKIPASDLVNLNTAQQSDLEALPGVGPKTAQAIIQYRDSNGGFKRVEDLLLIKGIGAKKYDAIKSLVKVGK